MRRTLPGFVGLVAWIAIGLLLSLLPHKHPLVICELMEWLTRGSANDALVSIASTLIVMIAWLIAGAITFWIFRALRRTQDLSL